MAKYFEPRNKLERVIRRLGGVRKVSYELDVDQSTINHWLRGLTSPNLKTAWKLVKISEGKLTYEDILRVAHDKSEK